MMSAPMSGQQQQHQHQQQMPTQPHHAQQQQVSQHLPQHTRQPQATMQGASIAASTSTEVHWTGGSSQGVQRPPSSMDAG